MFKNLAYIIRCRLFLYKLLLLSYAMFEFERDPIQNQTAEKLHRLGIEAVVFDLDDTLIYTSEIFRRFMAEYVETVSRSLEINSLTLGKRLRELNDEGYRKMGVSPERWSAALDQLSLELNNSEVVKDNLSILMKIYVEEPRLRPGAKAILSGLGDAGFKLGMVTHANTDWTLRKLTQTGLINYFDAIEIANENGFKTVEHWKRGMDSLGVVYNRCLVVGDNLKGDIIPAVSLGARAIWMPSPWSEYRQGEVPKTVVEMNELSDFWGAVQKLNECDQKPKLVKYTPYGGVG
ncbi:HAD family hydrolase [bacterium]|nr:MAG: HAD family hydrolase [bacterium]